MHGSQYVKTVHCGREIIFAVQAVWGIHSTVIVTAISLGWHCSQLSLHRCIPVLCLVTLTAPVDSSMCVPQTLSLVAAYAGGITA